MLATNEAKFEKVDKASDLENWLFFEKSIAISSVDRGGGGGATAPPIGVSTKMQNEKNATFLALLRPLNVLEWTK